MVRLYSIKIQISKFFSHPLAFHYIRYLFNFGFNTKHVKNFLCPKKIDMIIDVGCGIGYYSKVVEDAQYLGFDSNAQYIDYARSRFANSKKKFLKIDFIEDPLPKIELKPNKCLLIGVIHHLSDHQVRQLFDKLSKMNFESIVTQDPFYSKWHFINNLFCWLDRGRYVRTESKYKKLILSHFDIISSKRIMLRNLLTNHILFKIKPKYVH